MDDALRALEHKYASKQVLSPLEMCDLIDGLREEIKAQKAELDDIYEQLYGTD